MNPAHEIIRRKQAEIEQLSDQLSIANSTATKLRLTANDAYESIITTISEIEINRIMTTEERRWVQKLQRIANDLNPYPGEHDNE